MEKATRPQGQAPGEFFVLCHAELVLNSAQHLEVGARVTPFPRCRSWGYPRAGGGAGMCDLGALTCTQPGVKGPKTGSGAGPPVSQLLPGTARQELVEPCHLIYARTSSVPSHILHHLTPDKRETSRKPCPLRSRPWGLTDLELRGVLGESRSPAHREVTHGGPWPPTIPSVSMSTRPGSRAVGPPGGHRP